MEYDECPHCGASLIGNPIPDELQELFGTTHFRRDIAIYDRKLDRTIAYCCPDCGDQWPRKLP